MHLNAVATTVAIERDNAPIVSDTELHHWGEVYLANAQLRARGILFETFLRFPSLLLALVVFEDTESAPRTAPIEPAVAFDIEREVRAMEEALDVDDRDTHLHCRGGALVEPLHHHRYYKPRQNWHNPRTLEASR